MGILLHADVVVADVVLGLSAASQCRVDNWREVDDVPFFDPLEIWKLQFYRNAIKVRTSKVRRAREP